MEDYALDKEKEKTRERQIREIKILFMGEGRGGLSSKPPLEPLLVEGPDRLLKSRY